MRARIYTKTGCQYSARAKELLNQRGVEFEEINITEDPARRDEMIRASGGASTTPQVFLEGRHIGGFQELQELDRNQGVGEETAGSGI